MQFRRLNAYMAFRPTPWRKKTDPVEPQNASAAPRGDFVGHFTLALDSRAVERGGVVNPWVVSGARGREFVREIFGVRT